MAGKELKAQTIYTNKWQEKAGMMSKSYKLKKAIVTDFANACNTQGQSQSNVLTALMTAYIAGEFLIGTPKVGTPSEDIGTPKIGTPSEDIGTPKDGAPSEDIGTPKVGTPSEDIGTPKKRSRRKKADTDK